MRSGSTTSRNTLLLGKSFPSGLCMINFQLPPGLTSISSMVVVNPFGPHHFTICVGSVHAFHTSCRGASKTRETTISRSDVFSTDVFALALATMFFLLFLLNFLQVLFETIKTLFPKLAVRFHPVG